MHIYRCQSRFGNNKTKKNLCKMSILRHLPIPGLIFLHMTLSLFFFAPGKAAGKVSDVLDKGRNITDGDTLVSAGGSFTLGFFSPAGGVPSKRYLGIWFSFSTDAVYWVANRDRPLNGTSGALVMMSGDTGSLVLLDGSGIAVWSSSGSASSPLAMARLLESGNFVVYGQDTGGTALWQSFDHPCNTLLPGMKIGKNLWTGAEWHILSWRSATDPAPGTYRYVTDTVGGMAENVILDGNNTKLYRTGPWNGKRFSGVPEMASFADMYTYQLTVSPSEVTYSYTAKAGAPYSRVVVSEAGVVQRLVWDSNSRSWKTFFKAPRDDCDGYAKCGAFGVCDSNAGATSLCGCVKGFSPVSQQEWSMREYSGGCRRNVALDCSSTDGFLVLRGVKLPDTQDAAVDMSLNLDDCRARCLANCSCVAYAAANIQAGTGCVTWIKSFVDLRLIDDGQDIYQRLENKEISPPEGPKKKDKKFIVPVLTAGVPIAAALLVAALFFLWQWWRRTELVTPISPVVPSPLPPPPVHEVIIPSIRYETFDFATGNIIGIGSFGTVYKCMLPNRESALLDIKDNENVAVKVLRQSDLISYERELKLMSKLSHINLVRLLACCNHKIDHGNQGTEERILILVYEYMQKGSLDHYIFGDDVKRAELRWPERLKIIPSIAEGVLYLHVGSGKKIIHRDLKPANILLADDWTPKIADFGLAKHVTDPAALHTPFGPHGYSAPECWRGETTDKSDVYSFGVLLLEVISGRQNGVMQELLPDARNYWNNNEGRILHELLDKKVPPSQEEADPMLLSRLKRCIQIGLLCVQQLPEKRPSISQVVEMLRSEVSQPTPQTTIREKGETSGTVNTDNDGFTEM